jgi:hypothetical protein
MPVHRSRDEWRGRKPLTRKLRRWFTIGSVVLAAMYAIDPDWPIHLRRLVLWIVTLRGSLRG